MTLLFLGDSHLDRVRGPLLDRMSGLAGAPVENRAVGGSTVHELAGQADGLDLATYDAVVVSVGTNDAASWAVVELDRFVEVLTTFVVGSSGRLVFLGSPGVDEVRLLGDGDRTSRELRAYADAAASLFGSHGHRVVRAETVVAPLGPDAFLEDGVHLSDAAYDLLLPALAAATVR